MWRGRPCLCLIILAVSLQCMVIVVWVERSSPKVQFQTVQKHILESSISTTKRNVSSSSLQHVPRRARPESTKARKDPRIRHTATSRTGNLPNASVSRRSTPERWLSAPSEIGDRLNALSSRGHPASTTTRSASTNETRNLPNASFSGHSIPKQWRPAAGETGNPQNASSSSRWQAAIKETRSKKVNETRNLPNASFSGHSNKKRGRSPANEPGNLLNASSLPRLHTVANETRSASTSKTGNLPNVSLSEHSISKRLHPAPNETGNLQNGTSSSRWLPAANETRILPKVLAIYFPQYHKDPLNDKNWGENFTDWVSLQNASEKNILGYPIPRPTDHLGYYNLNEQEPRSRQADLAKKYGVDGFIYHHYWFYDESHPGPTLAQPLLNMLRDGHPDIPFFFNWCTVNWINVWMGRAIFQTIPTNKNRALTLQEQFWNVSDDEVKQHYDWLAQFFHHRNYIRVANQPVFMTYTYDVRSEPILERLRKHAVDDGFDGLFLLVGRSAMPDHIFKPPGNETVVMQELLMRTMVTLDEVQMSDSKYPQSIFNQSMTYPFPLQYISRRFTVPYQCLQGRRLALPVLHGRKRRPESTGVITTFDNSPRRPDKEARIYNEGTKEQVLDRFRHNLFVAIFYHMCCVESVESNHDRFVAINAWNEWGEGMALEPSDVYGEDFLRVIQEVKLQVNQTGCDRSKIPKLYHANSSDTNATADEIKAAMIEATGWLEKRKNPKPRKRRRTNKSFW